MARPVRAAAGDAGAAAGPPDQLLKGGGRCSRRWSRRSTRRAPRCCSRPTSSISAAARSASPRRSSAPRRAVSACGSSSTASAPTTSRPSGRPAGRRPGSTGASSTRPGAGACCCPSAGAACTASSPASTAELAFCGGINLIDDYRDPTYGTLEQPRFDFAVRVHGPLVADVHETMARLWLRMQVSREAAPLRLRGGAATRCAPPPAPAPTPTIPS